MNPRRLFLLLTLTIACGPPGSVAPPSAPGPDAGAPAAAERDAGSSCPSAPPLPSFAATRIAITDLILGRPAVAIAGDGKARVFFLAGQPDQPEIFGADPTSGATRKLSEHGFSHSRPRFMRAPDGGLRGVYDAADTTLRYLVWSGDPGQEAADLPVTPDVVLPARYTVPPAMALDGRGEPVTAAVYGNDVRVARQIGGGDWAVETVASGLELGGVAIAMALDPGGQPVVAGLNETGESSDPTFGRLQFGVTIWSRAGTGWSQTIADEQVLDLRPRAVSAPGGDVAIFFARGATSPLALAAAVRRDGGWQVAPLADAAGRRLPLVDGEGFDVTYGPDARLHVAYPRLAGGLGYAVYDGCQWADTVVNDRNGSEPAIALDDAGRPHIAFDELIASGGDDAPLDTAEVWYAAPRP